MSNITIVFTDNGDGTTTVTSAAGAPNQTVTTKSVTQVTMWQWAGSERDAVRCYNNLQLKGPERICLPPGSDGRNNDPRTGPGLPDLRQGTPGNEIPI